MTNYEIEDYLSGFDNEEEKERNKKNLLKDLEKNKNNIDTISFLICKLIEKLSKTEGVLKTLDHGDRDTLNSDFYFDNFTTDTGDGYIGNNFGQDLRNFKRFIEYAKSKGTKTLFFHYG